MKRCRARQSLHLPLVQCDNVRVGDNFFEILTVNLQAAPYICYVIEGCNELVFIVWVAVTLPSDEVRAPPVARQGFHLNRPHFCEDAVEGVSRRVVKPKVETDFFHMIMEHLTSH